MADDRLVAFVVFVVVVVVFVGMATGNFVVFRLHFRRFRLDLVIMMAVVIFVNLDIFNDGEKTFCYVSTWL